MTTLRSRAFARVLDLVSEGEIEGLADGAKSIYLDGTPLESADGTLNFKNVSWSQRTGTQNQSHISGIPAVESETSVNVELKNSASITRTVSNSEVDSVRITVSLPSLFQTKDDGGTSGQSVQIAIDLQEDGGSFVEVLSDTISGKATSKYQRSYLVTLTGTAPWNIRLRRITADTTNIKIQNKTFWDSYTEIIDAKLRYPNSALLSVRLNAASFSGVPSRAYDLKLKKIKLPSNYNPTTRAYTGTWDGTFVTAWSDNPAWCFYDLVTNTRYGLGGYIDASQVDKWTLYSIGQYCDELVNDGFGGQEPRFTCNMYLQSRTEAFKVVQDMASCFRSMVYWASGSLTLTQDAPSDPVALFSQANVVDGLFTYSGSSSKARHTVALVTWNDPADMYTQKVEYVEDQDAIARFGVVPTEVVAIGCTSRGQANRVGRWLLYSERYEAETVTFKTGVEGAVARPGQVIKVADASRAGLRLGGRVRSATTSVITLDAPVTLGASSWTIYAMLPDGTVDQSAVASASGNAITLVTALADAPQPGAQWVMSTTTVEAQTFRVLTVTEQDDGLIEITGLKHDQQKYDAVENGLVLQPRDITALTPVPEAPTDLVATESLYTYQAEVRAMLSVGWTNVVGAYSYRVEWSKDDSNFIDVSTNVNEFELLDITPGAFTFRVYAVTAVGKESADYAELVVNALGKTAPPADVSGLDYAVDKDIGVNLSWEKVPDIDVDAYEIRRGTAWGTAEPIGQVKATIYSLGYIPTSAQTFLVKALDTSGTYSTNAASTTFALNGPSQVTIRQEVVDNNVLLRWTASEAALSIRHYIVKRGPVWASAETIGTVAGLFSAIFETSAGTYTYWVAAVDIANTVGTPTPVTAIVSQPPDYTLRFNQNSTFSGTLSNMASNGDGTIVGPFDVSETWESHFSSRGYSNIQAQIAAGFEYYLQPSATNGSYEEIIDYGSVISSTRISVTPTTRLLDGTPIVKVDISVRKLTTDPWTDYTDQTVVFASDFQYVKIKIRLESSGGDELVQIAAMNVRFDVKLRNDAGDGTAAAGDSGGTTVNFNIPFIDVRSITVTPKTTTAAIAVYDFTDSPNPTSFKVLLFNTSGARISGPFSWSVKGV